MRELGFIRLVTSLLSLCVRVYVVTTGTDTPSFCNSGLFATGGKLFWRAFVSGAFCFGGFFSQVAFWLGGLWSGGFCRFFLGGAHDREPFFDFLNKFEVEIVWVLLFNFTIDFYIIVGWNFTQYVENIGKQLYKFRSPLGEILATVLKFCIKFKTKKEKKATMLPIKCAHKPDKSPGGHFMKWLLWPSEAETIRWPSIQIDSKYVYL